MAHHLKDVNLDEVSLVDRGANTGAAVLLSKVGGKCTECGGPVEKDAKGMVCKDCGAVMKDGPTQGDVHVNTPIGSGKKPKKKKEDYSDVEKNAVGVKFIVGLTSSGTGSVRGVSFAKSDWDLKAAQEWVTKHGFVFNGSQVLDNSILFSADLSKAERLRTITPGASTLAAVALINKQLNAEDSWNSIQSLVCNALREKYNPAGADPYVSSSVWVKDMYDDYILFDKEGQTYRVGYSIREGEDGEQIVTFADPAEVVDAIYMTEEEQKQHGLPGGAETIKSSDDGAEDVTNDIQKRLEALETEMAVNKFKTHSLKLRLAKF